MSPLTGVLREAWAMYRRFAAHFLLIAFVLYLVSALIGLVLSLAGGGGGFVAEIINLFFLFLLQAALVKAVQDVRDGRVDLSFSEHPARPRCPTCCRWRARRSWPRSGSPSASS